MSPGIWGVPIGIVPTYASDGFSGGAGSDINGRSTDSALGGTTRVWAKGTAGSTSVGLNGSGSLINGTGGSTNITMLDGGADDVFAYLTIGALSGTNQSLGVCVRQNASLSAINCYYARIQDNGGGVKGLLLLRDVNGSPTNIGVNGLQSWAPGDTIGVKAIGSTIQLIKNGAVLESVTDTTFGSGRSYCGVRVTASAVFAADDFVVRGP